MISMLLALTVVQFGTGNDLLAECQGDYIAQAQCTRYVAGVVDGLSMEAYIHRYRDLCLPPKLTQAQLRDVTVKYMVAHPEERKKGAAGVVWLAVTKAYPCPKPPAKKKRR